MMYATLNMMRGVLYSYLFISSIIAGYMSMFCLIIPIIFISNNTYRKLADIIFTFWQQYPTALLRFLCGTHVVVTGDPIVPGTTSLLLMNHRTRTDWNFLWSAIYQATCQGSTSGDRTGHNFRIKHSLKFVLKDSIRHIPGCGWVMQLGCCLFIKRNWNTDKLRLENMVKYFTNLKQYSYSLVLYPEGTDFTLNTKIKSDQFAEKHRLQKYDYCLHPKTKGFTALALDLLDHKGLDCIHDVTIIYPDVVPQTELDLIKGNFPRVVRLHFKRYNKEVLPTTEPEMKTFLENLWKRKEQTLKDFYENGNFAGGPRLKRGDVQLHLAFIFWTFLPGLVLAWFYWSPTFRLHTIATTLLLLYLNHQFGGFQNFELEVWKFKKTYLPEWLVF